MYLTSKPIIRFNIKTKCLPPQNDIHSVSNKDRLKKRYEHNFQRGIVKQFYPGEQLQQILKEEEWNILDVRPEFEQERAPLHGSVHIPLFTSKHNFLANPGIFIKWLICLGMGGAYQGFFHTELNPYFIYYASGMFNRNDKLLVVCQQGLRSIAAADQLYLEGFKNVAVLQGGLNQCYEGFQTSNEVDPRYGDVGGIQGFLGLTKTQKTLEHGFGKGGHLFRLMTFFLALDLGCLLVYYITAMVQQNH